MSIRVIVIVALLLQVPGWVCAGSLADGDTVEQIRADLLKRVRTQPVPDDLKQEYISLIQDDSKPLDNDVLSSIFKDGALSPHDAMRRDAYVIAWIFRYRSDAGKISALFDRLNSRERDLVLGLLLVQFKQWINQGYLPLAEKGLIASIELAQSPSFDRNAQYHHADMARSWVEVAVRTGHPEASRMILSVLRCHVADSDLRFNLVSETISRAKKAAMDVAEWYFQTYCFSRFQVQVLGDYFLTYLDGASADNRLAVKEQTLRQAAETISKRDFKWLSAQPSTKPVETEPAAGGQLKWETTQARLETAAEDRTAIALFRFENAGATRVSIKGIETSCGCTDAKTDKKTYEVGEHGILTATVTVDHVGPKTVDILVLTDQDEKKPVRLTVVVIAPELVRLDPTQLRWERGDRKPKTVEVIVTHSKPIHITEVKTPFENMSVKIETVEVGRKYRLIVDPNSKDSYGGTIKLITDFKAGNEPKVIPMMFSVN